MFIEIATAGVGYFFIRPVVSSEIDCLEQNPFAMSGCANASSKQSEVLRRPPKEETKVRANQGQALQAAYQLYKKRGFSDERARSAAINDVPWLETATTYPASTAEKEPAFDDKFERFSKDQTR